VVANQGSDPKNSRSSGRARAHDNEVKHVPAAAQSEVDLQGPAQNVGGHAITKGTSPCAQATAEAHNSLSVQDLAGENVGAADQQGISRAQTQQKRHYQTNRGIPGDESNARNENNFRPVQQCIEQHERNRDDRVAKDEASRKHGKNLSAVISAGSGPFLLRRAPVAALE